MCKHVIVLWNKIGSKPNLPSRRCEIVCGSVHSRPLQVAARTVTCLDGVPICQTERQIQRDMRMEDIEFSPRQVLTGTCCLHVWRVRVEGTLSSKSGGRSPMSIGLFAAKMVPHALRFACSLSVDVRYRKKKNGGIARGSSPSATLRPPQVGAAHIPAFAAPRCGSFPQPRWITPQLRVSCKWVGSYGSQFGYISEH